LRLNPIIEIFFTVSFIYLLQYW